MPTKILCIHGFRSNGLLLSKSIKSLTKKLNKYDIQFDCITSPIAYTNLDKSDDIEDMEQDYKQWWSTTKLGLFDEPNYNTIYDSIKYIYDLYSKEKYDGILGYSQGSVLVQIILYLQEYPELFGDMYKDMSFKFKFGITSCTFNITDNILKDLYNHKLAIPILNIYGSNDTLVPYNISESFGDKCLNITNYKHEGKHYVPTTKDMYEVMLTFIKNNIENDVTI